MKKIILLSLSILMATNIIAGTLTGGNKNSNTGEIKQEEFNIDKKLLKIHLNFMKNLKEGDYRKAYENSTLLYGNVISRPIRAQDTAMGVAYLDLGEINKRIGNLKKASKQHEKALDIFMNLKKKKKNKFAFARASIFIGDTMIKEGNAEGALKYLSMAGDFLKKFYNSKNVIMSNHKLITAVAYGELDRIKTAGILFNIVRLRYQKNPGRFSLEMSNLIYQEGLVEQNEGNFKDSMFIFNSALAIAKKSIKNQNHPFFAKIYKSYGFSYIGDQKYKEAIEEYKKALEIYKVNFNSKNILISSIYNNIGISYKNLKDFDNAIEYTRKALEINIKIRGLNSLKVGKIYNNLGGIYYANEDFKNALKYMGKALLIYEDRYGKYNTQTKLIRGNIEYIKLKQETYWQ